jgi:hypothetical protein
MTPSRTELSVHIAAQVRVNIVNELREQAEAYTINDKVCSVSKKKSRLSIRSYNARRT